MKMLIAVALAATTLPVFTTTAIARDGDSASRDRRHCTQVSVRAGSRMSGRRVCKTAAEWRDMLGPDWRQLLTGRVLEHDLDTVASRTAPVDESIGQQGVAPNAPGRQGSYGPN